MTPRGSEFTNTLYLNSKSRFREGLLIVIYLSPSNEERDGEKYKQFRGTMHLLGGITEKLRGKRRNCGTEICSTLPCPKVG